MVKSNSIVVRSRPVWQTQKILILNQKRKPFYHQRGISKKILFSLKTEIVMHFIKTSNFFYIVLKTEFLAHLMK